MTVVGPTTLVPSPSVFVEEEEIPRSQPPSLAVAHGQLDRATGR